MDVLEIGRLEIEALQMAGRASARPMLERDAERMVDQVRTGGRLSTVLVACALGVFAYASGHAVFSNYLQIPQIPGAGELVIICAAIAATSRIWISRYCANQSRLI